MTEFSEDRLQDLFVRALQVPQEERQRWLAAECQGDEALLAELILLLQHANPESDPLEAGLQRLLATSVRDSLRRDPSAPLGNSQLRCPACRVPIELVDDDACSAEVTCPSCGSKFSVVDSETHLRARRKPPQIGRFEWQQYLGSGAFGEVWKARDPELDRIVAIKFPRKEQLSPSELKQFLRDAQSAARLRHPNIVKVHEVGRDGSTIYIVSDYFEGGSLAEALAGPPLGFTEIARLCAQIAAALHHAHKSGVIHRDLKPANIMLDNAGVPHVIDFGLAKRDAGDVSMTLQGKLLGTPAYMSPEQARGDAHTADGRSDVYSLGVILFEMLTGVLPFRGTAGSMLQQVLSEEAPRPANFNARVPCDLETVSLKCLEKLPKHRFASAQEVADELSRYLRGEPIDSRPLSSAARLGRWARRHPLVAGLSAALGLALMAGLAVSLFAGEHSRRQAEKYEALATSEADARLKAESRLRTSRAEWLSAQSEIERDLHPQRSALLAVEAVKVHLAANEAVVPSARQSLIDAVNALDGIPLPKGSKWAEFSPDGRRLFVATDPPQAVWYRDLKPDGADADWRLLAQQQWLFNNGSLSPDGRWLITGFFSQDVRLWDLRQPEIASSGIRVEHLAGQARDAKFSPDSTRVAISNGNRITLLSLKNGAPGNYESTLDQREVDGRLQFSPDGKWLISSTGAAVWWLGEPTVRHDLPGTSTGTPQFTSNGRWMITKNQLWRLSDGKETPEGTRLPQRDGQIINRLLSRDSRYLLAAEQAPGRNLLWLWDLESPDLAGLSSPTLLLEGDNVSNAVDFSADARFVAAGGASGTTYVWKLPIEPDSPHIDRLVGRRDRIRKIMFRGSELIVCNSFEARVLSLGEGDRFEITTVLSPEAIMGDVGDWRLDPSRRFLLATVRNRLFIWDSENRESTSGSWQLRGAESWQVPHFSPDGRWVVNDRGSDARLWELKPPARVMRPRGGRAIWGDAQFSANGGRAVIAETHGYHQLTKVSESGFQSQTLVATGLYDELTISQDGRHLVQYGQTGAILREADSLFSGEAPEATSLFEASVVDIAMSPEGNWLVLAGTNPPTLRAVNLKAPHEPYRTLSYDGGKIRQLLFSPDGRMLLVLDKAGKIWSWPSDQLTPSTPATVLASNGGIRSLVSSASNRWLIGTGRNGKVVLWPLDPSQPDAQEHPLSAAGNNLTVSGDGRWLFTSGRKKDRQAISCWDLESNDPGQAAVARKSVDDNVELLAASPDGRWLLMSYEHYYLADSNYPPIHAPRLWRVGEDGLSDEYVPLTGHQFIGGFAFSDNGRWLVTSNYNDSVARVWDLNADDIVDSVILLRGHENIVRDLFMVPGKPWVVSLSEHRAQLWDLDLQSLLDQADTIVGRELDVAERRRYLRTDRMPATGAVPGSSPR